MFRIKCTNEEARSFKDCQSQNVTSLTIKLFYPEYRKYPRYNCLTDSTQGRCDGMCKYFNEKFEIIIFQVVGDKIQPAYKGLNNCYQPKIQLPRDSSIKCYGANFSISFFKLLSLNKNLLYIKKYLLNE